MRTIPLYSASAPRYRTVGSSVLAVFCILWVVLSFALTHKSAATAPGSAALMASVTASQTWTQSGPDAGLIYALLIAPDNSNVLYAAVADGGVYKSIDGGATWGRTSLRGTIRTLAFAPNNSATIYAAVYGSIFKTTDGGATWTVINSNSGIGFTIFKLVVDPNNINIIYATTHAGGVFKSTDGGINWTPNPTGFRNSGVFDLLIHPTNANVLYAAADGEDRGVFKSTDGGVTWVRTSNGIPDWIGATALAFHPTNFDTLFAATSGSGVYKSSDGGANWISLGAELGIIYAIKIDPTNPDKIYLGAHAGELHQQRCFFKSIDGGATWGLSNNGFNYVHVSSVVINPAHPNVIYAGTYYGGIFKSTDAGANWTRATTGIKNAISQSLAAVPGNPATVYLAHAGGVHKSADSGATWIPVNNGITNHVMLSIAAKPADPQTLYLGTEAGLYKTSDGGASWTLIQYADPYGLFFTIATNPAIPNIVYGVQSCGVYKSTDGGVTGAVKTAGLPPCSLYTMALAPSQPNTLYVGAVNSAGVFKSIDGGESWTEINNGLGAFRDVLGLAVHPNNPNIVIAATNGAVFKTTNGGMSWNRIPNLPETTYFSVLIDPQNANVVYLSGGISVFRSLDGGNTWKLFGSGLPEDNVRTLALAPGVPTVLYAGTGGNSVYKYQYDAGCVVEQPKDQIVTPGRSASFSVISAAGNLNYQWRKNGVPLTNGANIFGVNTATLTIANVAAGDLGNYDVVLNSTCGSATSRTTRLKLLPEDLAEGNASDWGSFAPVDNAATSVSNDAAMVRTGAQSIKFVTASGFDTGVTYPGENGEGHWNLSCKVYLTFWAYADNPNPNLFQNNQPVIVLKTAGGDIRFEPQGTLMTNRQWRQYMIPLAGDDTWIKTTTGTPTLTDVNRIEIHQDTWDNTFTIFYDGVSFFPNTPPTINGATITAQKGSVNAAFQVATINAANQNLQSLSVKINGSTSATNNGVTVNNLSINAAGNVSASITATCVATTETPRTFTITVTDNCGVSANSTLTVNVSPNAKPVLSYNDQMVAVGGTLTVNPASGPSDNGSFLVELDKVQPKTGLTVTVNPTTGVIALTNITKADTYTVDVNITDNCNQKTSTRFKVVVTAAARATSNRVAVNPDFIGKIGGLVGLRATANQV